MDALTPRSGGYAQSFSAGQLKSAGFLLSRTLSTLAGNCEYKSVNNPTAKGLLSDMHSQAVDAQTLVDRTCAVIGEAPATPASDLLMQELVIVLAATKEKLDKDFLGGNFDNHVQKAVSLNRWFTLNVDRVNANLVQDQLALSRILYVVSQACQTFLSEWRRASDKNRNKAEAERTGSMAKKTYTSVLAEEWGGNNFALKQNFREDEMDILSIPSIDKEMQELGSKWAQEILAKQEPPSTQGQDEDEFDAQAQDEDDTFNLLMQADAKIREVAESLTSVVQEADLKSVKLPADVALKWSSIMNDLKVNSRDDILRIGVFGVVNHGKTSIINSLIGRVFLHTEDDAATAWPLLVRHKPNQKEPEVTIDQPHFKPYITFIQNQRFSERWQEPSGANPQGLNVASAIIRISAFMSIEELIEFEKPDYAFKNPTGAVEIQKLFRDINILMRCCYVLASDTAPFPALHNANWPLVELEFDAWGSKKVNVELLDLPGLDEIDTKTPEHIFSQALQTGVDGCIIAVRRQASLERGFKDMMDIQTHRASHEPALAAIVTHSERKSNGRNLYIQVATSVWKDARAERRAVFCAPGLYASAITAMIHSFDMGGQKLVTPGVGTLPDPEKKLKDLKLFWDSLPCRAAVFDILDGDPDNRASRDAYKVHRCGTWKAALDDLVRRCKQPELVQHFDRYVLSQGAYRRQLYSLTQARTDLRGLIALQSDLISVLLNIVSPKEDTVEPVSTGLHVKALEALQPWIESGKAQEEELAKTLQRELEDAHDKAKAIVSKVVGEGIPAMRLRVLTQQHALTVVKEQGDEIKLQLAQLAREYVFKIRGTAKEAWAGRIKSLTNKLREIYILLPLELMDTLQTNAIDLDQAVREATTREIAKLNTDPKIAEKKWNKAKAKPWLSHQFAQAKLVGIDLELKLTPEETAVVDAVNQLGYLLRAPVSGEAKSSPLFSDSNWPMLTGKYPVDLHFDDVTRTFTTALVNPWIEILGRDSEQSVLGAVRTASVIAGDQLKAIIKRRTEWYEETQKLEKTTLVKSGIIDQLVLQQARCCLLYGAIDEVCDRWMDELSIVLPKIYKASEQKEKRPSGVVPLRRDSKFASADI